MRLEQGLVVEARDGMARVRVGRHAECTSCGACAGARNVMVDAVNPLGARPGQRVRFEMQESHALAGAFVVFVLPLLLAGAGALLGWQLAGAGAPAPALWGAAAGFLLSLPLVRYFDRKAARSQELHPVIVEILGI